jgi:hypothetical protein
MACSKMMRRRSQLLEGADLVDEKLPGVNRSRLPMEELPPKGSVEQAKDCDEDDDNGHYITIRDAKELPIIESPRIRVESCPHASRYQRGILEINKILGEQVEREGGGDETGPPRRRPHYCGYIGERIVGGGGGGTLCLLTIALVQLVLLAILLDYNSSANAPAVLDENMARMSDLLERRGGGGGEKLRNSVVNLMRESLENSTLLPYDFSSLKEEEDRPTFTTSRHQSAANSATGFCPTISLSCPSVSEKLMAKILKKTLDAFLSTQYLVTFDIVGEYAPNVTNAGWGTWQFNRHPPKYPMPPASKIPAWGNFCMRTSDWESRRAPTTTEADDKREGVKKE